MLRYALHAGTFCGRAFGRIFGAAPDPLRPRGATAVTRMTGKGRSWLGQALLYGALAAFIGVFSHWPAYEHLAPERALIKLSFIHHGQRLQECRTLPPEELAKLPPNMRAPVDCPRERAPIVVEVDVDGTPAVRELARPTGVSGDGAASVYQRIETLAGVHRIDVRLRDSSRATGFDHARSLTLDLQPARVLVIDFDPERGGITFNEHDG